MKTLIFLLVLPNILLCSNLSTIMGTLSDNGISLGEDITKITERSFQLSKMNTKNSYTLKCEFIYGGSELPYIFIYTDDNNKINKIVLIIPIPKFKNNFNDILHALIRDLGKPSHYCDRSPNSYYLWTNKDFFVSIIGKDANFISIYYPEPFENPKWIDLYK